MQSEFLIIIPNIFLKIPREPLPARVRSHEPGASGLKKSNLASDLQY